MPTNRYKKIVSFLLCIMLIAQLIPAGVFTAAAESAVTTHQTVVPAGYKAVRTAADLNAVRNNLSGKYIMMNDIDLTAATAFGGSYYNSGKGWIPICYSEETEGISFGVNVGAENPFTGIFDGNGYAVKGMKINSTGNMGIGLFSENDGTIINLAVKDCKINVTAKTIVYAGSISGSNSVDGIISNCSSSGEVTAVSNGGFKFSAAIKIMLQLLLSPEEIADMEAELDVGVANAGGIVGVNAGGTVTNCYNTGKVSSTGRDYAISGGIAADILEDGTLSHAYNTGAVSAVSTVETAAFGSIAGASEGTVSDCYYLAGPSTVGIGIGIGTATACTIDQLKQQSTFAGFDFTNNWRIDKDNSYPYPIQKIFFCTVTGITLNSSSLRWAIGKSGTLVPTITPTGASVKTVSWVSGNTKVATVSAAGVVKAIGLGTTTLTCTAKDGSGKKAVCSITVGKPVTAIKLNTTNLKWTVGKTGTLVPTITPTDAIDKRVTWSSSNKNVVTVDSAGRIKIVGIGTAVITCTAADGSGKKAVCTVTGIPGTPSGVKAVKYSSTSIKITWSKVTGATGYEVWRSLSKTGTYTKVKTISGTAYTNAGLTKGKTYYYKVYAYKTVGSSSIKSASSSIVYIKL